jgi:hypothetical protein
MATALRERLVGSNDPPSDLEEIWRSPCLAHVARLVPFPGGLKPPELREWWEDGLRTALIIDAGGFEEGDRARRFAIPPEPRGSLTAEQRRQLSPWICEDGDPTCERTQSYRLRAEESFEASRRRDHERFRERGGAAGEPDTCRSEPPEISTNDEGPGDAGGAPPGNVRPTRRSTPFEGWASCRIGHAPEVRRYARVKLRAPDRGWLVLRGRRGHYDFADEIRAYDLATGAAYIARSESALALRSGGAVDLAATDRTRRIEAYTGAVSPEQLRELAFVLVTAEAVLPTRAMEVVDVPGGLPLALSSGGELASGFGVGHHWGSSAQTRIAFTLVDGASPVALGDFTWPYASDPVDDHAAGLVRVMEAGLIRRCVAAPLPDAVLAADAAPAVSHRDAAPERLSATHGDLDRALRSLRSGVCPDAR